MANTPKVDMITSFSGGEFTPALAGHVDFEAYKSGSRFLENLIPEIQGGLKKFYGTREISILNNPSDYVMVPFDGQDEPVVLVIHDGIVSVVDGDDYYDTDITVNVAGLKSLTWVQQNMVLYFAHPTSPQFLIRCYGRGDDGKFVFKTEEMTFIDVPYFPVGWNGNFNGTITTDGEVGTVHVEAGTTVTVSLKVPDVIAGTSGAINVYRGDQIATLLEKWGSTSYTVSTGATQVQIIRRRNGVESVVATVDTGVEQHVSGKTVLN